MTNPRSTSALLRHIAAHEAETITVGRFVTELKEGGLAVVMLLFALPPGLPLPATGVGTVLGWPVLFASVQLVMGRKSLWLPKWIAKKQMKMSIIRKAIHWIVPRMETVEHLIRPRMLWLSKGLSERLFGLMCVICTISVLIPLPLTNTIPSAGTAIMAVGLLERDGLVMLLGAFVGFLGCLLAACVMIFGVEAVRMVF